MEMIGMANSKELCPDCRYCESQGNIWRPWAQISHGGWAKIQTKLKERRDSLKLRRDSIMHQAYDPYEAPSPAHTSGSAYAEVDERVWWSVYP